MKLKSLVFFLPFLLVSCGYAPSESASIKEINAYVEDIDIFEIEDVIYKNMIKVKAIYTDNFVKNVTDNIKVPILDEYDGKYIFNEIDFNNGEKTFKVIYDGVSTDLTFKIIKPVSIKASMKESFYREGSPVNYDYSSSTDTSSFIVKETYTNKGGVEGEREITKDFVIDGFDDNKYYYFTNEDANNGSKKFHITYKTNWTCDVETKVEHDKIDRITAGTNKDTFYVDEYISPSNFYVNIDFERGTSVVIYNGFTIIDVYETTDPENPKELTEPYQIKETDIDNGRKYLVKYFNSGTTYEFNVSITVKKATE